MVGRMSAVMKVARPALWSLERFSSPPEDSDLYPRHNRSLLITVTVKGPDVDLYITTFSRPRVCIGDAVRFMHVNS